MSAMKPFESSTTTRPTPVAPEFVSFHSDRPAASRGAHPNANLDSDQYMEMLNLLFRSARMFHPGAACTLLTDRETRIKGLGAGIKRYDVPVDHGALMLSRSLAQLEYVDKNDFARPLVLIDSDILVRGSLQSLFAHDFDVALTWRASESMPINGGLIILNNRRAEAARAFLRSVVEKYSERYASAEHAGWFGDQLALRDAVGMGYQQMADFGAVEIHGCKILFLPCELYNFSPKNRFSAIASGLPRKIILHFKGERKRLMRPFWEAFLQPEECRWPWARVLGAVRRRRVLQCARREAGHAVADAEQGMSI